MLDDKNTFERFNFKSLEDLKSKIDELNLDLETSDDLDVFKRNVKIGNKFTKNSFAFLPMEGCDSNTDGSPSDLTYRRYERFFKGRPGLVWFEACAVVNEGRANPQQLMITEDNKGKFKDLMNHLRDIVNEDDGEMPVTILQLTHSGRYSRPTDKNEPIIPQRDPLLDEKMGLDENYPIVTDEYLDDLKNHYLKSAKLAKEVGFDGVDIKACHRYLISELLASHCRDGKYGGSFENRIRLLIDIINLIRKELGEDFIIASRFNVYDAHPYPYGFGVDKEDFHKVDLNEPLELVKRLKKAGVSLISNSAGNPYYINPNITRPFDIPTIGGSKPEEHPLMSVSRLMNCSKRIKEAAGDIPVIGNGYSWLRHFLPYIGANNLINDYISMVGLGRESFAYPNAPKDLIEKGKLDPKKCCIACSKCTQIMRDHGMTGCVIKDKEVYLPLYRKSREEAKLRS